MNEILSKKKILFSCTFYGARSLIAYEFARLYLSEHVDAHCCCFEQGGIGERIHKLMMELDIETHTKNLTSVFEHINNDEVFDYVVTLCNPYTQEDCATFLDASRELVDKESNILLWPIDDFLSLNEQGEQWMNSARIIRDDIKSQVLQLMDEINYIRH
jgi:protein-tyrosine-phosphatase